MIIFDLRCAAQNHVFEAWFGSSADYEWQRKRGLVACPVCGSAEVGKAPMAPRLGTKSNQAEVPDAGAMKKMLADMAAVQKKMLDNSEHVGDRFPDEARAIHLGDAEARAIHGRATRAEAESLVEDGIPVAPLLFPHLEPGEEN